MRAGAFDDGLEYAAPRASFEMQTTSPFSSLLFFLRGRQIYRGRFGEFRIFIIPLAREREGERSFTLSPLLLSADFDCHQVVKERLLDSQGVPVEMARKVVIVRRTVENFLF